MKVTEQVAAFAEPIVKEHGCELWDVEYVREGSEYFLRLYIDKDGGVTARPSPAPLTPFWTKRTRSPAPTILRFAPPDWNGC